MLSTKSGTFCTSRSRQAASLLHCYDMPDVTFSQPCPKDSSLLGCDAVLFGKWFHYFKGLYCIHLQSENTKGFTFPQTSMNQNLTVSHPQVNENESRNNKVQLSDILLCSQQTCNNTLIHYHSMHSGKNKTKAVSISFIHNQHGHTNDFLM
jgi:hypothetical protein